MQSQGTVLEGKKWCSMQGRDDEEPRYSSWLKSRYGKSHEKVQYNLLLYLPLATLLAFLFYLVLNNSGMEKKRQEE